MLMTGSLYAMQDDEVNWWHPCLPRRVYREVCSDLLIAIKESPAIKQVMSEFVLSQLHSAQKTLKRGDVSNISCQAKAQMVAGMYLLGDEPENRIKASALYSYGGMVNDFLMMAIRKRLGKRADDQHEIETWHLELVSEQEFYQSAYAVYKTKQSILRALLIEEICVHKVLCDLAGIKYPLTKPKL